MKVAARAPGVMVETTPADIGDGVQRPAVLAIGWRQVASAAEKRAAEAASAMAEAMSVMVVAAAAAVTGRRSRQSDLVGRHGRHLRTRSAHTFDPALPLGKTEKRIKVHRLLR